MTRSGVTGEAMGTTPIPGFDEAGDLRPGDMRPEATFLRDTAALGPSGFDSWVAAYPDSYWAHLARGIFYIDTAEKRRGTDWAREVPAESMAEMHRYLKLAQTDLEKALTLTRKPYHSLVELIIVSRYSDKRASRRKWLDRANQMEPNNIAARYQYMFSLTPRWGGTYRAMERFVRESEAQGVSPEVLRVLKAEIPKDKAGMAEIRKEYAEAMRYYREALSLNPPGEDDFFRIELLEGYVRAAYELKRLADVTSELDELIRIGPSGWACVQRAWLYEQDKQYDKAWPLYLKGVELGNSRSQYVVGWNLYNGAPSVPQDRAAGVELLRKSAAQGEFGAQKFLESLEAAPR